MGGGVWKIYHSNFTENEGGTELLYHKFENIFRNRTLFKTDIEDTFQNPK